MNTLMVGATDRPIKAYSLSLVQKLVRLKGMESALDYQTARALLEWQIELGATDAIGDAPIDRFALPDTAPKAKKPAADKGQSPPQIVVKEPKKPKASILKTSQKDFDKKQNQWKATISFCHQ